VNLGIVVALLAAQENLPAGTKNALDAAPSFGEALTRMVWMLAITILLLVVVAKYLPKWLGAAQRPASRGLIKVIEARSLEPRKTLYLVQVVDQYYLLGSSDQRIEVLAGGDFEPATLERLARESETMSASRTAPAFVHRLLADKPRTAESPLSGGES
jgi:flagellar biosynthetic protein FliO